MPYKCEELAPAAGSASEMRARKSAARVDLDLHSPCAYVLRMTPKGMAESKRSFRGRHPQRRQGARPSATAARPKRAVNVSVDAEILEIAKHMEINLSQVLEGELRKRVREERVRRFQEEHREAIDSYNQFIAKHGIWSEKYRKW